MKKLIPVLICVLLIVVSCATSKKTTEGFGDWWDNPPADTAEYHYEVGLSQKAATLQITRDWAKANANSALAQYVNNSIDTIVTTYSNDAGTVGEVADRQALAAFESISKQRAQAVLTGVTYAYKTMNDGTVYVLAQLPIGEFAETLKANVTEAFVKNAAAEEANEMMNAAIEKYFGM